MLYKQFLSIFEGFRWCEFKNSIFSKSNDNIKNLAREILDMDSLKLQLQGFDYSCKTEAYKIRKFKLKKWFFKHQSSFRLHEARKSDICGRFWLFENFFKMLLGVIYGWNWSCGTPEPLWNRFHIILNDIEWFKRKSFFDTWIPFFEAYPWFFNPNVSECMWVFGKDFDFRSM